MRTQIWEKYVPVIRILMKKAVSEPQVLDLNRIDFEGAGVRKTGFKFKIEFRNGKVDNIISSAPLARLLADEMFANEQINEMLQEGDFTFSLNPKYELTIKGEEREEAQS